MSLLRGKAQNGPKNARGFLYECGSFDRDEMFGGAREGVGATV